MEAGIVLATEVINFMPRISRRLLPFNNAVKLISRMRVACESNGGSLTRDK
jgi:hypothetical protein